MSIIPIVPAVIPKTEAELIAFTKTLRFSHEFHLDLVDGNFVPSVSWPYEPWGEPIALKPHTDSYTLEVDLMVTDPYNAAKAWIKAGADMLVFHIESIDLASFIDMATYNPNVSMGVSLHGDTPLEKLYEYIPHAEYVQLMGIHTIGLQGQPFAEDTLSKIAEIKSRFPQVPVSVDGSVNRETIQKIVTAGADRLIVGSAIVQQSDPQAAYQDLRSLIDG